MGRSTESPECVTAASAADEAWQATARQSQVTKPNMRTIIGSLSSLVWPEGQPAARLAFTDFFCHFVPILLCESMERIDSVCV